MKIEKYFKHTRKMPFPIKLIYVYFVFQLYLIFSFFVSLLKWELPKIIQLTTNENKSNK